MGSVAAPQWLIATYCRAIRNLGATAEKDEITTVGQVLAGQWSTKCRFFHNLKHVIDVLAAVDELAESTRNPDAVRIAAWYHGVVFYNDLDVVYGGRGGENPAESAQYCRADLEKLGVPAEATDEVCRLILSLDGHNSEEADIDAQVLSDADLSVLAAEPQRFREYRDLVRKEYGHVPQGDFISARARIVTKLLARKNLYASPLAGAWEATARQNLQAELERLEAELADLQITGEIHVVPAHSDPELADSLATVAGPAAPAEIKTSSEALNETPAPEDTAERNPYATATEADMISSMESCEDLLDTMTFKALKDKDSKEKEAKA